MGVFVARIEKENPFHNNNNNTIRWGIYMADRNIVVGLDVGTTKVAVCVGQISEGLIHVLALTKAPNNGLRKGIVVDIEECVSSISGALEHAERSAGVPLDHAVVGIGGSHIVASGSK